MVGSSWGSTLVFGFTEKGRGCLHRIGELMSETEAEVEEIGDGSKLPFKESLRLVGSRLAEDVGRWSGVGSIG